MEFYNKILTYEFIIYETNARNRYLIHKSSRHLPWTYWRYGDVFRESIEKRLEWWEDLGSNDLVFIRNFQEIIELLRKANLYKVKKVIVIQRIYRGYYIRKNISKWKKCQTIYLCSVRKNIPKLIVNSISLWL